LPMLLDLSPELELLQKAARDFAVEVVAPRVAEMEEREIMPPEILDGMAERGFFGVFVSPEYGGAGMGHLARALLVEEVSRVSAAAAMSLEVFHIGIAAIAEFGSAEQRAAHLPALAAGRRRIAFAVTESGGGSDPGATRTVAEADGDDVLITGRKVFITNAHPADLALVLARDGAGGDSFSCYLVPADTPGYEKGRVEHKIGLRGCNTGELSFDRCRVPGTARLGAPGDGLRLALKAIGEVGRASMAACALGLMAACLDASRRFANERELYGRPIGRLQAIQFKIADMATELEAARALVYRACSLKDAGRRCDTEVAMAKYFATEAAVRAAQNAMDIHGGYGVLEEYDVQRYYRDARVLIPSTGTSEIMKLVIARQALKE